MQPSTVTEQLFTWFASQTPPILQTDQEPALRLLLELDNGHILGGEYNHQTASYWIFCERFDGFGILDKTDQIAADLVDEHLDWTLEETFEVKRWMWIMR